MPSWPPADRVGDGVSATSLLASGDITPPFLAHLVGEKGRPISICTCLIVGELQHFLRVPSSAASCPQGCTPPPLGARMQAGGADVFRVRARAWEQRACAALGCTLCSVRVRTVTLPLTSLSSAGLGGLSPELG